MNSKWWGLRANQMVQWPQTTWHYCSVYQALLQSKQTNTKRNNKWLNRYHIFCCCMEYSKVWMLSSNASPSLTHKNVSFQMNSICKRLLLSHMVQPAQTILLCPGLMLRKESKNNPVNEWFDIYSKVPLKRSLIYYDITYDTVITVAESESDIRITTDTPHLALTGELWDVYCEDFGVNWWRYNGTAPHCIRVRPLWCFRLTYLFVGCATMGL